MKWLGGCMTWLELRCLFWGALHHPDFPQARVFINPPLTVSFYRDFMGLKLSIWIQRPELCAWMPYEMWLAFCTAHNLDPDYDDIPF